MQPIKDAFFKFCSGVSMALTRDWGEDGWDMKS